MIIPCDKHQLNRLKKAASGISLAPVCDKLLRCGLSESSRDQVLTYIRRQMDMRMTYTQSLIIPVDLMPQCLLYSLSFQVNVMIIRVTGSVTYLLHCGVKCTSKSFSYF